MVTASGPRSGRLKTAILALALAWGSSACVLHEHPVMVPKGNMAVAVLASGALLNPLAPIARHAWFAVHGRGDRDWERWEVWYPSSDCWGYVCRRGGDPLGEVGEGAVRVHAVVVGAEAERIIACLRTESPRYPIRHFYLPWPGPNSNTFVEAMLRKCNWKADLPATAIGKDYRGLAGASLTSGGTGFQIETPWIGLKLGLTEGIEIHILALTFGIDWWPLALKVPGGTGRVGWEDR